MIGLCLFEHPKKIAVVRFLILITYVPGDFGISNLRHITLVWEQNSDQGKNQGIELQTNAAQPVISMTESLPLVQQNVARAVALDQLSSMYLVWVESVPK